jgi:type II secretory pathway pseudopilin PulG
MARISVGRGRLPLSSRPLVLPSCRPARGATLVSALLALTIVAVCAGLLLQTCLMGSMLRQRVGIRAEALALCQSQMESLRAGGMHALPGVGAHAFATGGAALRGQTTVAPGPADNTRLVTVTVTWQPAPQRPAGRVELATVFAARGLSP